MRVLVTGGSGFIGSHVVDKLCEHGVSPRIFDLLRSPHHKPGEIDTFVGSLMDTEALRLAMAGCHAVIHLAAVADVKDVHNEPSYAENINTRGTLNVLEAARKAGVDRVIYGSTTWVYSDCAGSEVDEDVAIAAPSHLYTATKLAGETYCRAYSELYGIEYTILRFGIPYGPRARRRRGADLHQPGADQAAAHHRGRRQPVPQVRVRRGPGGGHRARAEAVREEPHLQPRRQREGHDPRDRRDRARRGRRRGDRSHRGS